MDTLKRSINLGLLEEAIWVNVLWDALVVGDAWEYGELTFERAIVGC